MEKSCKIENCENLGVLDKNGKRYLVKGYCLKHYKRLLKYNDVNITTTAPKDGRTFHPLYQLYSNMKNRCFNPKSIDYKYYGGRGITIDDSWLGINGFLQFIVDMGEKPSNNHSLERDDVNGNYCKSNCRWATIHEQASNKRNNNKVVGVQFIEKHNFYIASLMVNKISYTKSFKIEQAAIDYRKELELKYLNT